MLKRTVCFCCGAALLLLLAALPVFGRPAAEAPKELVELKVAYWGYTQENANALADSKVYQWIVDNLKIKIIPTNMNGDVNKYTLDMSSGTPSDIYHIYWAGGAGGGMTFGKKASGEGLLKEMGQLVLKDPKRWPVLNQIFNEKMCKFLNYSYTGDTNRYDMLYCLEYYKTVWGGLMYNMKWLNAHGLKMPNTYAEFIQLLRDIKKADPKVIPYGFIACSGNCLAFEFTKTFFNTHGNLHLETILPWPTMNDKWVMMAVNPKMKEVWKEVAGYYKEGLIDQEAITKDTWAFLDPDFASGKTIVMNANGPGRFDGGMMNWVLSSMQKFDPTAKMSDIAYNPHPLTGTDNGVQNTMDWPYNINYIYMIYEGCKNPDRALDFLEFVMSDKGKIMALYGIEGVQWKKGTNAKLYDFERIGDEWMKEIQPFAGAAVTKDNIGYYVHPLMPTSAQGKWYLIERNGGWINSAINAPNPYYENAVSDEIKNYLKPIEANWYKESFIELPIYTRYVYSADEQPMYPSATTSPTGIIPRG